MISIHSGFFSQLKSSFKRYRLTTPGIRTNHIEDIQFHWVVPNSNELSTGNMFGVSSENFNPNSLTSSNTLIKEESPIELPFNSIHIFGILINTHNSLESSPSRNLSKRMMMRQNLKSKTKKLSDTFKTKVQTNINMIMNKCRLSKPSRKDKVDLLSEKVNIYTTTIDFEYQHLRNKFKSWRMRSAPPTYHLHRHVNLSRYQRLEDPVFACVDDTRPTCPFLFGHPVDLTNYEIREEFNFEETLHQLSSKFKQSIGKILTNL